MPRRFQTRCGTGSRASTIFAAIFAGHGGTDFTRLIMEQSFLLPSWLSRGVEAGRLDRGQLKRRGGSPVRISRKPGRAVGCGARQHLCRAALAEKVMGLTDAPGMVSVGEFAFRNAMKVALTALRATW
jgi:hypothetical protein